MELARAEPGAAEKRVAESQSDGSDGRRVARAVASCCMLLLAG